LKKLDLNRSKLTTFKGFIKFLSRETKRETKRLFFRYLRSIELGKSYMDFRNLSYDKSYCSLRNNLVYYVNVAKKFNDYRFLTAVWLLEQRLGMYIESIEHEFESYNIHRALPTDIKVLPTEQSQDSLFLSIKESNKEGIGAGVLYLGMVIFLSQFFPKTTLVVEKRLLSVWQKSLIEYSNINVKPFPSQPLKENTYKTANISILKKLCIKKVEDIEFYLKQYFFLDSKKQKEYSYKYSKNPKLPIIGLTYKSSNPGKDSPDIKNWIWLIENFQANYLILQYGDISEDLEKFKIASKKSKSNIIYDSEIDLGGDLEEHFYQISTLDRLVCLASSTAFFATSIGIYASMIVDDRHTRQFPIFSKKTPWHPKLTVFHKNKREYNVVFNDILKDLKRSFQNDKT